jgi:hypothetical protein
MSLRSVSLDVDYGVFLSSKFQLQPPQNVIPVHADRPIAIVCSHDHAPMQYAVLRVGPSKSP